MVISLSPELDTALTHLADEQGTTVEEIANKALKEKFLAPPAKVQPQDDWERLLFSAASDCGVALSHEAVSSEGLYE